MFIWDEAKNRSNQKKHGVSFEAASFVFDDPFHLGRLKRVTDGEQRWHAIGRAGGILILLVIHTWKEQPSGEPDIRIISARRADKQERELYEEGD